MRPLACVMLATALPTLFKHVVALLLDRLSRAPGAMACQSQHERVVSGTVTVAVPCGGTGTWQQVETLPRA